MRLTKERERQVMMADMMLDLSSELRLSDSNVQLRSAWICCHFIEMRKIKANINKVPIFKVQL